MRSPQPSLTLNSALVAGALPAHAGRSAARERARRAPLDPLDTTAARERGARRSNARPPPPISSSPLGPCAAYGAVRRVGGLPGRICAHRRRTVVTARATPARPVAKRPRPKI